MSGLRAFGKGLSVTLRGWGVLVLLLLFNLLGGVLLSFLPGISLIRPAQLTAASQAIEGISAWMLLDALLSPLSLANLEGQASSLGLETPWTMFGLSLVLAPLLAWVMGAFLSGAALHHYQKQEAGFSVRGFFSGGFRWWGTFLILGLLQGALGIALLIVALIGFPILSSLLGSWVATLGAGFFLLIGILAWIGFDLARVTAVEGGLHNPLQALRAAWAALRQRPGSFLSLYTLGLALLAGIHLLFWGVLLPLIPLRAWFLLFLLQNLYFFLRLWARMARWIGGAALLSPTAPADPDTLPPFPTS